MGGRRTGGEDHGSGVESPSGSTCAVVTRLAMPTPRDAPQRPPPHAQHMLEAVKSALSQLTVGWSQLLGLAVIHAQLAQ